MKDGQTAPPVREMEKMMATAKQKTKHVAAEDIASLFVADFDHGVLVWRDRSIQTFASEHASKIWHSRFCGKEAGYRRPDGYRVINSRGRFFFAHRILWAMAHGAWPDQIDHINGIRSDNRIVNLRSVTTQQNNRNLAKRSTNASGVTGVHFCLKTGRWAASIQVNGKSVWLGRFQSIEEAAAARSLAEARFDFHPNHGRAA